MPVHEYVFPDGAVVERFFFPTEEVPETIEVSGETGRKIISRSVVKFKGAFSGGTASKHLVHPDDGSVVEPGRLQDVKRRRKELDNKREEARKKVIEESMADYNV